MPEYGDTFKVVRVQFGNGLDRYTYITDATAKEGDKLDIPSMATSSNPVIKEIGPNFKESRCARYKGEIKYAPVIKAKYCECCGQELKKNKDGVSCLSSLQ